MVASLTPPTGDLARNPGMCPGWRLFGLQAGAQSTEPHQPGLKDNFQSKNKNAFVYSLQNKMYEYNSMKMGGGIGNCNVLY